MTKALCLQSGDNDFTNCSLSRLHREKKERKETVVMCSLINEKDAFLFICLKLFELCLVTIALFGRFDKVI